MGDFAPIDHPQAGHADDDQLLAFDFVFDECG
jgi:hypothetical protein